MRIFGFGRVPQTQASAALAPGRRVRLGSPWSPGLSASIMAADWLGEQAGQFPVTREQAMRVPAVAAARDLVCLSLAQGALRQYTGDQLSPKQPAWMSRTDSEVAPQIRALWTWDDLFFSGYSLWQVDRTKAGAVGDAVRVPVECWDWDEDMRVLIDDRPARADEVILFTGWNEGLLLNATDAVKQLISISNAVSTRVDSPVPHTLIKETEPLGWSEGEDDPEDNRVGDFLLQFAAARAKRRTGAVSWVPYGVDVQEYGTGGVDLYEQGRNAGVLDVARHAGVPATLLEASGVASSLTYETTEATRSVFADRLRGRAMVMEARLSMDDVSPPRSRVALDLSHLAGPDTGLPATTED